MSYYEDKENAWTFAQGVYIARLAWQIATVWLFAAGMILIANGFSVQAWLGVGLGTSITASLVTAAQLLRAWMNKDLPITGRDAPAWAREAIERRGK